MCCQLTLVSKPIKKKYFKGIQAVRIEFLFLLKVANIRCFILIAVEILRTPPPQTCFFKNEK
jgi:hypothetical protein